MLCSESHLMSSRMRQVAGEAAAAGEAEAGEEAARMSHSRRSGLQRAPARKRLPGPQRGVGGPAPVTRGTPGRQDSCKCFGRASTARSGLRYTVSGPCGPRRGSNPV